KSMRKFLNWKFLSFEKSYFNPSGLDTFFGIGYDRLVSHIY
ncbi:hypothetical protein DERP_006257, partial [Dermatophagoides pteronyssinus]